MSNNNFRFKQFEVCQPRAAMKVGTDGVLLGAWMRLEPTMRRVLDVGTGTGLIALMAAQRSAGWGAEVVAVEVDGGAVEDAQANFASSPWADRLSVHHLNINDFAPEKPFDHIVCNPPYFVASLTSPDRARSVARHTSEGLTFDQLAASAARLLGAEGVLSVVLPTAAALDMTLAAARRGLFLARRTDVHTKQLGPSVRVLMEFVRHGCPTVADRLAIHLPDGSYSPEYRTLARDFYLAF